jgi:GNAT superfamily N-acetyltransferase
VGTLRPPGALRNRGEEEILHIRVKFGQTISVTNSIKREQPWDMWDIYNVNLRAFGRADEGRLVDRLRDEASIFISLVAKDGDMSIVGHILFNPVIVGSSSVRAAGLGPMAVLSEYQGTGTGLALVKEGLETCTRRGYSAGFASLLRQRKGKDNFFFFLMKRSKNHTHCV